MGAPAIAAGAPAPRIPSTLETPMPLRRLALALLAAAPLAAAAQHGGMGGGGHRNEDVTHDYPTTPCSGTLSGAVSGKFTCRADIRPHGQVLRIAFTPEKLPKSVGAFIPGELEVPAPFQAKEYDLSSMKSAQVLLSTKKHQSFAAGKTAPKKAPGQAAAPEPQVQGDITVKLDSVKDEGHSAVAKGTMTARLVPSKPGEKGEVRVVVKF